MLYRAGFLSRYLEHALLDEDIPYRMWGSFRFYDRMEIRDTIAYLRMVVYQDNYSFLRVINVPRRKMGKNRVTYIKTCAEEEGVSYYKALVNHVRDRALNGTGADEFVWLIELFQKKIETSLPSEILNELLDKSGYRQYIRENGDMERLDNLAELCKSVTEYERNYGEELSLEEYLNHVALRYDEEERGDNNDFVRLMTIHASKGLEFPCVFVAGMSDGVFPSSRSIEERKQAGLEEERRLCFVAMTRARERLYLTESEGFGAGGQRKYPSRFLFDVDEGLYERIGTIAEELEADFRKKAYLTSSHVDSTRFIVGNKVNHIIFGEGEIQSLDVKKGVYNIYFRDINKIKPIGIDYDFSGNFMPLKQIQSNALSIPNTNINNTDIVMTEEIDIYDAQNTEECSRTDNSSWVFEPEIIIENYGVHTSNNYEEYSEEFSEEYTENYTSETSKEQTKANTTAFIDDERESAENTGVKQYELTYDPTESNLWKRADVPHEGWSFVNLIDLGTPSGVCGMCGHQIIRYVHIMTHPDYPGSIGAGSVCAGRMEGNYDKAEKREREYKNTQTRRRNFLKRKWKKSRKGNLYLTLDGVVVIVLPDKYLAGYWRYSVHNEMSKNFPSLEQAKLAAFDMVIYGKD
jgi:DNA helicase-2/ATP-dependent DNA helicase PcrA